MEFRTAPFTNALKKACNPLPLDNMNAEEEMRLQHYLCINDYLPSDRPSTFNHQLANLFHHWAQQEDFSRILRYFDQHISKIEAPLHPYFDPNYSTICQYLAESWWYHHNEREAAFQYLAKAFQYNRCNMSSYHLLRTINHQTQATDHYFRIQLKGNWKTNNQSAINCKTQFICRYGVAASSTTEAISLIQQSEIPIIREQTLLLDSYDETEKPRKALKGVYCTSPLQFFTSKR